jgi:hypothetical protein
MEEIPGCLGRNSRERRRRAQPPTARTTSVALRTHACSLIPTSCPSSPARGRTATSIRSADWSRRFPWCPEREVRGSLGEPPSRQGRQDTRQEEMKAPLRPVNACPGGLGDLAAPLSHRPCRGAYCVKRRTFSSLPVRALSGQSLTSRAPLGRACAACSPRAWGHRPARSRHRRPGTPGLGARADIGLWSRPARKAP